MGSRFRDMSTFPGTDLLLAVTFRHERFEQPPAGSAATDFVMVARDALGRPVPHAQVFAVAPSGPRGQAEGSFLGLTSPQGVISIEPVREAGDLVVVAGDGSLQLIAEPQASFPRVNARLAAPGRVLLAPSLRPAPTSGETLVWLTFRRLIQDMPGLEVVLERCASEATGWEFSGLPMGPYQVRVQGSTRQVLVPEDGFAVLQ
jgi:hypothetical protein